MSRFDIGIELLALGERISNDLPSQRNPIDDRLALELADAWANPHGNDDELRDVYDRASLHARAEAGRMLAAQPQSALMPDDAWRRLVEPLMGWSSDDRAS
jgi:hypothetical protein